MKAKIGAAAFALNLIFASLGPAATVQLQQATATFSQTSYGGFLVSAAIDGVLVDPTGWGIHPEVTNQTAVFETATNVGYAGGTVLTFTLIHNHYNPGHTLGRFRLSVTTDDRSTFADGLATGGDVSANWTVLDPASMQSANGTTLTKQPDLSILAGGSSPGTDTYIISAVTSLTNITGVRLDALQDASLPFNGPGRAPITGSFVVSELQLDASASDEPVAGALINLDFGAGIASVKVGVAAIGQATNDFWNYYDRNDGNGNWLTNRAIPDLKYANGTASGAGVIVENAPGAWGNASTDAMYAGYVYPFNGGDVTVTFTNLPAGRYDLLAYGQNGKFEVIAAGTNYGIMTCRDAAAAGVPDWAEGVQYVRFRSVVVQAGQPLVVIARPTQYDVGQIAGLQLYAAESAPPGGVATPSGLVSWWKAEGNAEDAVGGNHGFLSNGVSFAQGEVGQTFNFNGSNSYVEVPDSPSLRLTNTLTIEFWVRRQSIVGRPYGDVIISKGGSWTDGVENYGVTIADASYGNLFQFTFAGGNRGGGNISDLNWHHCAVVAHHGDVDPTLYIDGVQQPVTWRQGPSTINLYPSTSALRIGAQPSYDFYSHTLIDELSIYDRALSAAEIQAIFNAGSAGKCTAPPPPPCVTPPSGLVSWWRAEQNGIDALGANNGTLQGGVTFVPGEVGQAFDFDGTSGYVNVPSSPALKPTGPFTVEAWIRMDRNTSDLLHNSIVTKGQDAHAAMDWCLSVNVNGKLNPHITAGGVWGYYDCNTILSTGVWYHVAMVYTGASLDGYVNGVLDGTGPISGAVQATDFPLRIGAYAPVNGIIGLGQDFFDGQIDEVSVYDHALSAAEIHALFNAGSTGKCMTPEADTNSYIFVSNYNTNTIRRFKLDGTDLGVFATVGANGPYGLAVDTSANLYVGHPASNTILKFSPTGTALGVFASTGLNIPVMLAFDVGGNLYAANAGDGTVRKFSPSGQDLGNFVTTGPVNNATGLAFDSQGNLYVAKYYQNIVLKFAPDGSALGTVISSNLSGPTSVGVDSSGNIYVANDFVSRVAKFSPSGAFLGNLVNGGLGRLIGLTLDSSGNVYVARYADNRVRKFGPTGVDLGDFLTNGLSGPTFLAVRQPSQSAVPVPPTILAQPADATAHPGEAVSFNVSASGPDLVYQWQRDNTNLDGSARITGVTNAQLVITNVQASDAGTYSVIVSNLGGLRTSSNAILTVIFPPAAVRVVSRTVTSGDLVAVPITLTANGNENALGFSLTLGSQQMPVPPALESVVLGSNAAGATLVVNTNQWVSNKRLGIALALPSGATFAPGVQEVVQISFQSGLVTGTRDLSYALTFGDVPTVKQVSSTNATALPANYYNGFITLTPSDVEGDTAPRPNGDRSVTITDWVQAGRFVALLDTPAPGGEFQRADTAPASTRGNGVINVTDWVQVGRYAAGLDPWVAVGGPTSADLSRPVTAAASGGASAVSDGRELRTAGTSVYPGQTVSVPVLMESQGNENALSFSVNFDPAVFTYAGLVLGSNGVALSTNVNVSQVSAGRVGIVAALATGSHFAAGTRELLKVNLLVSPTSEPGAYPVSLGDQPVSRSLSDPNATELTASYTAGTLTVMPLPALEISQSGTNVTLSWPATAGDFVLQALSDGSLLNGSWTNVPGVLETNASVITITLPLSADQPGFYRLRRP